MHVHEGWQGRYESQVANHRQALRRLWFPSDVLILFVSSMD